MKKIILLSLFVFGCTARPEYYSYSQKITLEGISYNTMILHKNEDQISENKEEKSLSFSNEINFDQKIFIISRSWSNQELIIRKAGFKDYHLKLDSVITKEAWATMGNSWNGERHYFPLLGLLFPLKTLKSIVSVPYYLLKSILSLITISPVGFSKYIIETGNSIVELPISLISDIYDIIGVPGTIIINPWKEFKYNPVIILEPTEILKKECSVYHDSFISNNGCIKCLDTQPIIYSSEIECKKCQNRKWNNGVCSIK